MNEMLRRRAMMGQSSTPAEVVFYDRLVGDGVAYIDTGLKPSLNDKWSFLIPCGDEVAHTAQYIMGCSEMALIYSSATTQTSRTLVARYNSASLMSMPISFSYSRLSLFLTPLGFGAGEGFRSFSAGTLELSANLLLFATNGLTTASNYTGSIRQYNIYSSEAQGARSSAELSSFTPIYTFKPCTYNGEAGMWCEELGRFFGNANTSGSFTVAND